MPLNYDKFRSYFRKIAGHTANLTTFSWRPLIIQVKKLNQGLIKP